MSQDNQYAWSMIDFLPFSSRFLLSWAVIFVACNGTDPADVNGTETPAADDQTGTPAGISRHTYRIVNVFPHDPDAWTQGLVFDNGVLLEGTGGGIRLRSHPDLPPASLREVELTTGRVLRQVALETEYFGEGITLLQDRVFQLTWLSGVGFTYNRENLTSLGTFSYASEGWGLTHDGERLIRSDGTSTITFHDPKDFAEVGQIEVATETQLIRNLNELEFVEGQIWANVWQTDVIARIDPATGSVVGWIDLTGLLTSRERAAAGVANGIAYDPETERIFVTGKLWPWMFEIALVVAE